MKAYLLLAALWTAPLAAQATLGDAARAAQRGWLAHDAEAVVGQSTRVVLQIPGVDPSAAVSRAQALALLSRYFHASEERGLEIVATRELEEGRGVVELERHYAVRGTRDGRRETVFLGFRLEGGRWILSELRSAL
jgi:hypothetical protein